MTEHSVAVMQPYFFPYLGYWQLLQSVDTFVVFDDVNFIQRGWIHRNRILVNNKPAYITIPIANKSQNKKICELSIVDDTSWQRKLTGALQSNYRKAPFFDSTYSHVGACIEKASDNLADFLFFHLGYLAKALGISTKIIRSSELDYNRDGNGAEKILDICQVLGATSYINAPGGRALYSDDFFCSKGISLYFIEPHLKSYPQFNGTFESGLSIVDAMMFNNKEALASHVNSYALES